MTVLRVTQHPSAAEQLLYFTSSSLWADDGHLVFISDRTGAPNLFVRDLADGAERQLSDNREGWLKSYVYFDGRPYAGFGKASVSLHAETGVVYYVQGREIRRVGADGTNEALAEYPDGQVTAFTHVSADGRRLCVPTTDARALEGYVRTGGRGSYDIDARVRGEKLSSYLRVFDTATGEEVLCERVPGAWITHVQFSPVDSGTILYNHEWPSDCGIRRMWLFEGGRHRALRAEGGGRRRGDWTCHEMWERDGGAVIYHGKYENGPAYIGRVTFDGAPAVEIALPSDWTGYGHFTVGEAGYLVCDGYYCADRGDAGSKGAWICRVDADWERGRADWTPLCRHGSSWDSQDSHPHPIFDHACRRVFFTSDRDGRRAVYAVDAR